jgi:hypothetical protein
MVLSARDENPEWHCPRSTSLAAYQCLVTLCNQEFAMRVSLTALLLIVAACQSSRAETEPPAAGSPAADSSAGAAPTQSDSSSAQPVVELRTDQSRYRAGGQVGLTLVNHSTARYAFNPCTRVIEREANGTWTKIEDEGRVCTMEAWILEPNATSTAKTELPNPLPPGRYRLVIALTPEGQAPPAAAVQAMSPGITVE